MEIDLDELEPPITSSRRFSRYISNPNRGPESWRLLETTRQHQKDDVVSQTAAIIRQLHSIPIPTAGPLGGGPSEGNLFTDFDAGPFNSGSELEAWFNHKFKICKNCNKAPQDTPPFDFQKFVLMHQGISPRNMILDAAGKVRLIDWENAGSYTPASKLAAISFQTCFPEFNRMLLHAMPEYDVEVRHLRSIWWGLFVAVLA